MKEKLLSKEEIRNLHPVFKGWMGARLVDFVFYVGGIHKANAIYNASKQYTGLEFVTDMLDKLGIIRKVENHEILDAFQNIPFITVSNHPYGHIDGIIAISVVAAKRKDFKIMVNWILNQIDTMEEHFIGVNPFSKKNKLADIKSSIGGVKQCLEHLKNGHPLGLFPAGGVSVPHLSGTIDRDWQPSVLKLIKKAKVPVIPMYISGNNSLFYRFLGFIDWRLRTARLVHEMTNKKGKTVCIRLGKPITVEEQDKFDNIEDYGKFLKQQTYALKK